MRNSKTNKYWIKPIFWIGMIVLILNSCKEEENKPVNFAPVSSFLVSNLRPKTGEEVLFTDQSSDEDGEVVSRSWSFGNGVTSTEQNPKIIYQEEGIYTVKLTVVDNDGEPSETTKELTVSNSNLAPVAAFDVVIPGYSTELFAVVLQDSVINFKDLSIDEGGRIVSWEWDMGNGITSTNQNITGHTYSEGGTYNVSLTVTDDEGESATFSRKVYVPSRKWTFPVNSMETSSPAIDDEGSIYVGDRGGFLYKISKDGDAIWDFEAGKTIRSSITLSDDGQTVYVGSGAEKFYAVKASNGIANWSVDVVGEVDKSSAALDNEGNLYFGTSAGILYALKASDGSQNWIFDGDIEGGTIQASPLYYNGKVIVAIDNKLFGVNANSGNKVWEYSMNGDRYEGHFAMDDNGILYGGSENVANKNGRVFAINATDGVEVWSKQVDGQVRANSPIMGEDGTLYVSTENGSEKTSMAIYAINSNNGSTVWKSTVAGNSYKVAPTLGKSGILYVGNNDDYLYMISSIDGSLICKFNYESADHSMPPVIGSDGTVYYGSRGNLFFAMRILDDDEEALPNAGWPVVGGNLKHQDRK